METVNVLGRIDGVEHLLGIDLLRQRQLHQDAVHRRIAVELAHQRQQLVLDHGFGQPVIERPHAGLDRHLGLAADVELACRIVAGEHDRKPRRHAVPGGEALDLGRDLGAQLRRDRLAIDDACGHRAQ